MTTATNVTINSAAELDLDTLDAVAGSSIRETSEDIDALRRAGYLNEEFGCLLFHWKSASAKVDEAWARAGVHCYTRPNDDNTYAINGKQVSHDKVLQYLRTGEV